jgi:hypothetical protein
MPAHPSLAILKKGLSVLTQGVQTRKDALMERLGKGEILSPSEDAWLDDEANHVDEDGLIEKLEKASDYEATLSRLDSREAKVLEKLQGLAGEVGESVAKASNKRKSACFLFLSVFAWSHEFVTRARGAKGVCEDWKEGASRPSLYQEGECDISPANRDPQLASRAAEEKPNDDCKTF